MKNTELSITTIRNLSLDSVEYAKHGHLGMPLGSASMGYILFKEILKHNPESPNWDNRDRFVLTSGHGSILLYSLLHLSGYDLTIDDLKQFRKLNSKTPGHPEVFHTAGVEATTGPLGQGFSMTVGLALGEARLAAKYNRDNFPVVDHYTYTICGDGDLQEGVALEAAAIAGNLGLNKLIVLYDSNDITSDGPIELSSLEQTAAKFEAMNWQVLQVKDGNDLSEIRAAIEQAQNDQDRPTLIEVKNIIGFGSPSFQGTEQIHSDPVGPEETAAIKATLGWQRADFEVPAEVAEDFATIKTTGLAAENSWKELFKEYAETYPELAEEYVKAMTDNFVVTEASLETFTETEMATRDASGKMLNRLYHDYPNLIGGSADLATSNKTTIHAGDFIRKGHYDGPNIHFGVREFAMASIENGLALHGGLKAYCGTFLIFSDYMRSAIRHAALMGVPVTFVMTHDSLQVGPDGPTHQPVEQLISLRAMPNLVVVRPADANETIGAWKLAIESKKAPHLIALGRHPVSVLPNVTPELVAKGAYVLSPSQGEAVGILIGTGAEVEMTLAAQDKLAEDDIFVNVVSMPSWELFEKQPLAYRQSVLPPTLDKRVSVELGSTLGWERYVGAHGFAMGVDEFGGSGPAADLLASKNFTVEQIVKEMKNLL